MGLAMVVDCIVELVGAEDLSVLTDQERAPTVETVVVEMVEMAEAEVAGAVVQAWSQNLDH